VTATGSSLQTNTVFAGDVIGGSWLLSNRKRTQTIIAETPVKVWAVTKEALSGILLQVICCESFFIKTRS
jgi:CRP-like cAMP-binding protein